MTREFSRKDFVRAAKGETGTMLGLRASPGARETSVAGTYGEGAIKLKVAAPPIDGWANAEIERFLARILGVHLSRVAVVRGASGRDKEVFVQGVEPRDVREGLAALLVRA